MLTLTERAARLDPALYPCLREGCSKVAWDAWHNTLKRRLWFAMEFCNASKPRACGLEWRRCPGCTTTVTRPIAEVDAEERA